MDVANESSQKGASLGNIHARVQYLFFVDGHFDVERAEIGQKPAHSCHEQLEGVENPVIAKVEGETLRKCTYCISRYRVI
jgi:hypothetical protein